MSDAGHTLPQLIKCIIKNLDTGEEIKAHFNPKEVGIDKNVPWNKHKDSKANAPLLEFTDADPMELSLELLFDTYEQKKSVYHEYVSKVQDLTKILEDKKRPPMVLFLWGTQFPKFMGVISTLGIKYTMFLADGTPVRATVTIKIKEGRNLKTADKKSKAQSYPEQDRPDKVNPDDHRSAMDDELE